MNDSDQSSDIVDGDKIEKLKKPSTSDDVLRQGISLSLHNISYSYYGVRALNNISCDIPAGERIGILGNSGAGKSTLCNVISGICIPDEGDVYIDEKKVTKTSALKRARRDMRRTFEHPQIFSDLNVEENIMIGSPPSQGDGIVAALFTPRLFYKERKSTARQIMEYCHIEPTTMPVDKLDYATKKRIELARALMGNPRILVLDEPTVSMSDNERAQYAQVVLDYAETFHTTVVVADNDIDFVYSICQSALVLDAGEPIAQGEVLDVLRNDEVMLRYARQD